MKTTVDRTHARAAFDAYVADYDPTNPRIALKVEHTLRVAELCARIAASIEMSPEDIELAWLLGLLHDIGRFEQVRRFDTFNDRLSVSHAALGVEILFDEGEGDSLIRCFLDDDRDDELIRTAVALHSAYSLPGALDTRTRTFCELLRDADKIDILKVNCSCPIEDIYGMSESIMRASALSPDCVAVFYEHRCIPGAIRTYPADIMLGHICFAWELVFEESIAIVREQGYLRQMLHRSWDDPTTAARFAEMAAHMEDALGL